LGELLHGDLEFLIEGLFAGEILAAYCIAVKLSVLKVHKSGYTFAQDWLLLHNWS